MSASQIATAIIGSCVTRDAFPDNGPFRVSYYQARTSILSIYADPVPLDEALFAAITPPFVQRCIRTDFLKTVMADMAATRPEIIVLDFIDERFNLFRKGGQIVSKSWDMYQSGIWRPIAEQGFQDAHKADPALHALMLDQARLFYADLAAMVGAGNVYIHQAECADSYLDETGTEQPFDEARLAENRRANQLIRDLVAAAEGILPAANVINVMEGARADASNRWSLTPFHYEPRYYGHFLQALQQQVAVAAEPGPSGSAQAGLSQKRTAGRSGP